MPSLNQVAQDEPSMNHVQMIVDLVENVQTYCEDLSEEHSQDCVLGARNGIKIIVGLDFSMWRPIR